MHDLGPDRDAFLATIAGNHGYETRVDVYFAGEKVDELGFDRHLSAGTVSVTGRNRERRSLSLTARESLWPVLPDDPLSPYGIWLHVLVTITAGRRRFPAVPVFAGKLTTARRARWSGMVDITAADPMWQVNREALEQPRPAPTGDRLPSAIGGLLREVLSQSALIDTTGSMATIPASTLWDAGVGSRGRVIDELAAAVGAEVFALPTTVAPGGEFVIRPVPSLTNPVDWTLPDGHESVVVSDVLLRTGASVVNRWIVQVERTDGPTLYVPVTDSDPTSPTRYGGPMGKLVDFYSSPLITSESQAEAAGRAKLARSIGAARGRRVEVPANPATDSGDVWSIGVDSEIAEKYIVDSFDLPLTPDPASMTAITRSLGGSE